MDPRTSLQHIYKLLMACPDLTSRLSMDNAIRFVRLASSVKLAIIHAQKPSYNTVRPPDTLPTGIKEFLSGALGMECGDIAACWTAFQDSIWAYRPEAHTAAADARLFHDHRANNQLMSRALYPPVITCINPNCTLGDKILRCTSQSGRQVVLYTFEDGACATYHFKLRCALCKTTYHHNYSVKDKIRTYYGRVPDVIEVGKHQFVCRKVANMFINLMLISWTSAANSAEIYNTCLSKPENQPTDWPFGFELRGEYIWNTISHLAILEYYAEEGRQLNLPHGSIHQDRLSAVIAERNRRFEEQGQPEWGHYCDKCIRFFNDENGQPEYFVRAIISDGITIGHPCCNVAHCEEALTSKRDRYCPGHMWLETCCSGTLACIDPEHQSLYRIVEADSVCPQKPETGIRKLRGRFGRRQTASEQFMLRPCGIVVARATFFGSETTPQTVVRLPSTRINAEFFIYDNCCGVYNHLTAQGDSLINEVGFPVDVFHFDCKHKKPTPFVKTLQSPKIPELLKADGSWVFNSSKAEQHFSWLGGYRPIFREMNADRYNFLLDELIMRKNRRVISQLNRMGMHRASSWYQVL
ncbi:hypothetical protein BJ912DRAFT_1027204 [Pholiota molesta]|nr:hypothetical protein BJ912DRAFT_1027204 [Pholiota molesta]